MSNAEKLQSPKLMLLPAYTGTDSIHEILKTSRTARLLWLEILVNDQLDLTTWQDQPKVKAAFTKACRWHTKYQSLIQSIIPRTPLPTDLGPIDHREYRLFGEALRFVANNH